MSKAARGWIVTVIKFNRKREHEPQTEAATSIKQNRLHFASARGDTVLLVKGC